MTTENPWKPTLRKQAKETTAKETAEAMQRQQEGRPDIGRSAANPNLRPTAPKGTPR